MAALTTPPRASALNPAPRGEAAHRLAMWVAILGALTLIAALAINGFSYYSLSLEERPLSPLHAQLRSSGAVGLKLGLLGVGMFGILFLYPLRKRVRWLARIGATRRWLRVHVLFGVVTPVVITFHTAFRWHGLAGLAYWTMVAVAVSGFIGRYVYAKIPRSLNSVKLTAEELQTQTSALAGRLIEQEMFRSDDLAPLLNLPRAQDIARMSVTRSLWVMLRIDLARPFQVSRLRRRVLNGRQRVSTLGGFLASHDRHLESIVANLRKQARLRAAAAFLDRTERIFHLWHVVHRPFSISFVVLVLVHVGVQLWVGLR